MQGLVPLKSPEKTNGKTTVTSPQRRDGPKPGSKSPEKTNPATPFSDASKSPEKVTPATLVTSPETTAAKSPQDTGLVPEKIPVDVSRVKVEPGSEDDSDAVDIKQEKKEQKTLKSTDGTNDGEKDSSKEEQNSNDNVKMAYEFDKDGLPIWEENKPFPPDKMPPRPSGYDLINWKTHVQNHYDSLRKKQYDILLKQCTRKLNKKKAAQEKERKRKEEEDRLKKEQEERQRQEEMERKKQEKRQKAAEVEKAGMLSIDTYFQSTLTDLDLSLSEFSDEDEEVNGKKGLFARLKPLNYEKKEVEEIDDPENGEEESGEHCLGKRLAEDCSDSSSQASTGCTPRRSPRIRKSQKWDSDSEMSTERVQILSNPHVLAALKAFQGSPGEEDVDTSILHDPNVLEALQHLLVSKQVGIPSFTSTPAGNPMIQVKDIKREHEEKSGQPAAKRKLVDYQSFQDALKRTPVRKKRKRDTNKPEVEYSMSSPTRGQLPSRDASTDNLLTYTKPKVETMKELDTSLRKSPLSSPKMTKALFEKVKKSKKCFALLCLCFVLGNYASFVLILRFILQLKNMGRCALEEENGENYNFFFLVSNYMREMEDIPEHKRAQEARTRIIDMISGDEKKFSRVSKKLI